MDKHAIVHSCSLNSGPALNIMCLQAYSEDQKTEGRGKTRKKTNVLRNPYLLILYVPTDYRVEGYSEIKSTWSEY